VIKNRLDPEKQISKTEEKKKKLGQLSWVPKEVGG
jgi:hypothetical protein